MDNYDRVYESYELCKFYYLKIDRFYYHNFEISSDNKLLTEKHFIDEFNKFNREFRSCYINLHLVIDNYNKQIIKLNTENVTTIKIEIERYKINIDKIINLIDKLSN